jgi:hypothetical protein
MERVNDEFQNVSDGTHRPDGTSFGSMSGGHIVAANAMGR